MKVRYEKVESKILDLSYLQLLFHLKGDLCLRASSSGIDN